MMFDIHQEIFDENGEFDSARLEGYIDGLMQAFATSPEAQPLVEQYGHPSWPATMMDFAADYLGVTPAKMSVADFNEVVFDLFPRKVSAHPESAEEIIAELQAFWTFVGRQYGVDAAQEIIGTLDDRGGKPSAEEAGRPIQLRYGEVVRYAWPRGWLRYDNPARGGRIPVGLQ